MSTYEILSLYLFSNLEEKDVPKTCDPFLSNDKNNFLPIPLEAPVIRYSSSMLFNLYLY